MRFPDGLRKVFGRRLGPSTGSGTCDVRDLTGPTWFSVRSTRTGVRRSVSDFPRTTDSLDVSSFVGVETGLLRDFTLFVSFLPLVRSWG